MPAEVVKELKQLTKNCKKQLKIWEADPPPHEFAPALVQAEVTMAENLLKVDEPSVGRMRDLIRKMRSYDFNNV